MRRLPLKSFRIGKKKSLERWMLLRSSQTVFSFAQPLPPLPLSTSTTTTTQAAAASSLSRAASSPSSWGGFFPGALKQPPQQLSQQQQAEEAVGTPTLKPAAGNSASTPRAKGSSSSLFSSLFDVGAARTGIAEAAMMLEEEVEAVERKSRNGNGDEGGKNDGSSSPFAAPHLLQRHASSSAARRKAEAEAEALADAKRRRIGGVAGGVVGGNGSSAGSAGGRGLSSSRLSSLVSA